MVEPEFISNIKLEFNSTHSTKPTISKAPTTMTEAHDASRREVAVWESAADLLALSQNKFNFQFAKSVLGKNGEITYNIVWQSKNLGPRLSISWEPIYALNWST